jgi:hypothetical protein
MQRKNARCLGEYSAPTPSNPNLRRAERARNARVELTVNVGARGAPDVVESPRQMAAPREGRRLYYCHFRAMFSP